MGDLKLRPCPHCNHGVPALAAEGDGVSCLDCGMYGPDNDPRGEKWNALPRREDLATRLDAARMKEGIDQAAEMGQLINQIHKLERGRKQAVVDPDEAMLVQLAAGIWAGDYAESALTTDRTIELAVDALEAIRARKRGE